LGSKRPVEGRTRGVTEWLDSYGLIVLFAILAVQSAGVPGPPGKTALVAASILAARGHLSIVGVIGAAVAGIVVGGYVGYAIGRIGGRRLLERPFVARRLGRWFEQAERFFESHGGKAVFSARFLPGLKVVAAPAAGVFGMGWRAFALWHAAAAVAFSVGFGLAGYFVGEGLVELIEVLGLYGLIIGVTVIAVCWLAWKALVRRRPQERVPA
jgi:membrane protein DedA with SNARE-associated domain